MSSAEHYFENLIHCGKDPLPDEPNKNALSDEVRETIEMCYWYVCNRLFIDRDDLDEYLKESEE